MLVNPRSPELHLQSEGRQLSSCSDLLIVVGHPCSLNAAVVYVGQGALNPVERGDIVCDNMRSKKVLIPHEIMHFSRWKT